MTSLMFALAMILSYLSALFSHTTGTLHTARFARLHELLSLFITKTRALHKAPVILIGMGRLDQLFCVRPTREQKELGNLILLGKTRIGKGLNIVTNLLTWPYPVEVNDIKRELWDATAGWRARDGRALIFDPRGFGNK